VNTFAHNGENSSSRAPRREDRSPKGAKGSLKDTQKKYVCWRRLSPRGVSDHRPAAPWRVSGGAAFIAWSDQNRGHFWSAVQRFPSAEAGTLLPTTGTRLALSRQRGQHVSGVMALEQGCARDRCQGRAGQSRWRPSWEALGLVGAGAPATRGNENKIIFSLK